MTQILMPKATAVWLVENTALSFDQIADFCSLHPLEVKGIADGDVATGIRGANPIDNKQLTLDEIERCQKNPRAKLKKSKSDIPMPKARAKGPRYTPIAKRQDKPDAIAWLVKHYPTMKDSQIVKLIGTTKNTITAIRERTHWNSANLMPRDPVLLGLCTQIDLNAAIAKVEAAKPVLEEVPEKSNDDDSFSQFLNESLPKDQARSEASDIKVILPEDLFKR